MFKIIMNDSQWLINPCLLIINKIDILKASLKSIKKTVCVQKICEKA